MKRAPRLGRAAAGVAIAFIVITTPVTAGASTSARCSATEGVTVIVDFAHFGGTIERGCAPGHPANALDAIHAAGFTTAGTAQYGDAFLCRIDGYPSARVEACAVTPSTTAYWAYWHAQPSDAKWTYSAAGVLGYHPRAGSIEAFAFGAHAQPGISPSAAVPTTSLPPPVQTAPATAATIVSTPTAGPGVAATTTSSPPPGATSTSSATTTTNKSAASTQPTNTTPPVVDRVASGPAHHDSSGSPLPALLTMLVVGALAIAAFAFARARRHRAA